MGNNKPKRKNKLGAGRPNKMKIWVEALKEVIEEETEIEVLTDEDLVFSVNDKIEDENCHITTRTLRNWKTGKFPEGEVGKEFVKCYHRALINQKKALMRALKNTESVFWTKYAWILERRFAEWNLKKISEVQHTTDRTIHITAANDEQKTLIDNIINVDFVELPKKQIASKGLDNEKEDDYGF